MNETFNQLIWERCPKSIFEKKNLQITLRSAAINFILGLSDTSHDLEVTPDQ